MSLAGAAPIRIRPLESSDWAQVAGTFAAGIATGNATFENGTAHRADLRYVVAQAGTLVGWVAASNVSDRCCYAGVIEDSVYVHPGEAYSPSDAVACANLSSFQSDAGSCRPDLIDTTRQFIRVYVLYRHPSSLCNVHHPVTVTRD